ncbi:MAG TPA: Gfo/Idh/MocA family oxidoreductase [Candidatus Didemnitutus sp.]|nr:Gfo/Idh/MocA family oxidoreductase [Candidatus Didemnitutus sp.]
MTPPSSRGFAIIGLGMIADFHAQAIAGLRGGRLVGVASRDLNRARAFAARHQVGFATDRIDQLCARPDVDVVCITTPAAAHMEPALECIRAGKHLVIEKPLDVSTERIDRILAAAESAGVVVAAIFQGRLGDGANAIKTAVAGGRLGRVVLASAAVKWHRDARYYAGPRGTLAADGGGVLMNQAIHSIDLLQWYAGLPREVNCRVARRVHLGIETEDTACATLQFPDGALGTLEATTGAWPGWSRRIELCGEKGSVALEDDRIVRWDFDEARPGDADFRVTASAASLGSGASAANAITALGHQRQLQDLVDALQNNRAPAVDGKAARNAVAIVQAMYESARRGVAVAVE